MVTRFLFFIAINIKLLKKWNILVHFLPFYSPHIVTKFEKESYPHKLFCDSQNKPP